MPLHNAELSEAFTELADLLELEGANSFRVRAYRNLARNISSSPESMADLVKRGSDLSELPGIGKDLAGKITDLVRTGKLPVLEEIRARTPPHLRELLRVPGLGPKRVRILCDDLHINCLNDLKAAAAKGLIQQHAGFGEKTERKIQQEIERLSNTEVRVKIQTADEFVETYVAYLKNLRGIHQVAAAGSYRRRKETLGDIDILVTGKPDRELINRCTKFEEVAKVLAAGDTKASVQFRSGIQVDIRLVPEDSFGAALLYFTGSKAHNIHIRKLGLERGLKYNEYGVFKGTKNLGARTEIEAYTHVGLPYIEPELREDRGEIEAALAGTLPRLVELSDIKGDLHCHTTESDGRSTLAEMVEAALARGYEYLAISDHSQRVAMARGLDPKRLAAQIRAIDRLNQKQRTFRILKSCEVDILEDGSLDLPDSILQELDLVTCSIHYKLNLPFQKQTDRILRAMDNPYFTILGHPTGRLLNTRAPCDIDLPKIMHKAKNRGLWLELNSQPDRLDLDDICCKMARDLGVKIVINTDAHHTAEFGFIRYGIAQARRGWLEAKDVINTLSLTEITKLLNQ